jgi:hypothetical protein
MRVMLLGLALILVGCCENRPGKFPFKEGQTVKHKMTGQEMLVIDIFKTSDSIGVIYMSDGKLVKDCVDKDEVNLVQVEKE